MCHREVTTPYLLSLLTNPHLNIYPGEFCYCAQRKFLAIAISLLIARLRLHLLLLTFLAYHDSLLFCIFPPAQRSAIMPPRAQRPTAAKTRSASGLDEEFREPFPAIVCC